MINQLIMKIIIIHSPTADIGNKVLQYLSLTDIILLGFTSYMLIHFRSSTSPRFVEQGSSKLLNP